MKRKNIQNINGISISDSIVMSVKKKRVNFRKPFSVLIALAGVVSIIMAFFGMFSFRYNSEVIFAATILLSAFYITICVTGGRALWLYISSVIIFIFSAYKKSAYIALGFKYVFNIIYKTSFNTEISFYKLLKPSLEVSSVTTLFFFYIWLICIVVYYFTICRPNPVLPLMVTFPILEVGMYNGIKVPVLWGMLCISFWLALLAMSTIDVGEYSGGQSGFVRKNNLFFPKRHMKLKVTEKCGALVVASVMLVSVFSIIGLRVTHYKRSEKLNQKRKDITDAFDNFSFDNLGESLANISNAFGFNLDFENHKLGTNDHISYRNVTDLTIKLEKPIKGALYLKDYVGSVYRDNEWFEFPPSTYEDEVFKDFEDYKIYPQDFPEVFEKIIYDNYKDNNIWIVNSERKKKHIYAPYGTINTGSVQNLDLKYYFDLTVTPKEHKQGQSSYKFRHVNTEDVLNELKAYTSGSDSRYRATIEKSVIQDYEWKDILFKYYKEKYPSEDDGYISLDSKIPYLPSVNDEYISKFTLTELIQKNYQDFVYKNYLSVPETDAMMEIREKYASVLNTPHDNSVSGVAMMLDLIRETIARDCEYSLQPGKTPSNRDFVNYFLLENKKGYCTSFASAGVILARMAGIPARYATGYIVVESDINSGNRNDAGSVTVDVKDNRSHAWAEIYIDEFGWIPYEFTAGYSATQINTDPTEETTTQDPNATTQTTTNGSQNTSSISNNSTTIHTSTASSPSTGQNTSTQKNEKFGFGFGHGNGKPLPGIIKKIFIVLFILAAALLTVLLRRKILLSVRDKRLNTGTNTNRVIYIYNYAEKLLGFKKFRSSNGNYMNFAEQIEKSIGGMYFKDGEFKYLTDVALKACYGNKKPDDNDVKRCLKTVESISEKLYQRSDVIEKIRLKFLNVLK